MVSFKGVLLDLGGVVYVGNEPLPGAIAAIDRLRDSGLGVRFLTNTTRTPQGKLLEELRRMGLALADDELFTPAIAARKLIEREGLAPYLLVHPSLEDDFAGLVPGDRRAVVIGDVGEGLTYAALNAAFRALDGDAKFLALANNRSFRDKDGGLSLDAGPFVAALAFASRREPIVLGKPAPDYFLSAVASLGCAPEETVMIGDDIENDVLSAMEFGLTGILVRTGKYEAGAELRAVSQPSLVADDLPGAVDWLLSRQAG